MWSLIERRRRPEPLLRTLVALTTIALAPACRHDDPLPTNPLTIPALLPAILGADVIGLGFDAVAINQSGQVAGTSNGHAVLWTPGVAMQDLGTLGGPSSQAYAINASGQVAGSSVTATGATHAFVWTPGQAMRDLGTLPGGTSSIARGINDQGDVVGQSTRPRDDPLDPRRPLIHAFRWSLGLGMEDLGTLGSLNASIANDINNVGQVVGRAYSVDRDIFPPTDPEFFSRAFLWTPGQGMQDLGDLGGGYSVAYALNDAGQVVGRSWSSLVIPEFGYASRAFLWTPGEAMREIGRLWDGPETSAAYGINDGGQVVGSNDLLFIFPGVPFQSFLWSAAEGTEALYPTTGFQQARAINDRQQVVGDRGVATLHLAHGNNAPRALIGGPYTGTEGSAVQLDLSAADSDDVGFTYTVSFGDGSTNWVDLRPPWRYTYTDDGTYTLALTVVDRRGGRDTKNTIVTIANVAPTILAGSLTGPTTPVSIADGGASAPIDFAFSDPAASNDVYAAEIACGNGTVLRPTNIPVSNTYHDGVYTGTGTYAGACTYTSAGVYTLRVTVSDEDGGTSAPAYYRYVIVYDPAGASAAGSGFYTVPGDARRKAHFTFDVKYRAGQSVPDGRVRFWVPGGRMNFESTAIEMLVASGGRAQFWGTGTLNRAAARFRITAVDGSADAFRIELWDGSGTTLRFDTQPGAPQDAPVTTVLEGGNIRVR